MKALNVAGITFGLFVGAVAATAANAYSVEYTYTSGTLAWEYTLINSIDYGEEYLTDGGEWPAFGFSFSILRDSLASDMPTTVSVDNADAWVEAGFFGLYPRDLQSTSSGSVSINPDGSISSWNILLKLSEIITPTTPYWRKLSDYKINISSSGGENTCNCDFFRNNTNVTTQQQHTYIIAATWEGLFKADTDFHNWSIKKTSVPDSQSWSLMLAGVFSIYAIRRKRRVSKLSAHRQSKN